MKKIVTLCLFHLVFLAQAQWTQVGGVALDAGIPPAYDNTSPLIFQQLMINPVTSELYVIALDLNTQDGKAFRPTVSRFDGTNWLKVGSSQFTPSEATGIDMTFHPDTGEPYVSYIDGGEDATVSVMRFDGTDWIMVGNPGFAKSTAGRVTKIKIHPATKIPYVVFDRQIQPGVVKLSAMKFDDSKWINAVPDATPYILNAKGSKELDFVISPVTGNLIVAAYDLSTSEASVGSVFTSSDGINWGYLGVPNLTSNYGESTSAYELAFSKSGELHFKFYQHSEGKVHVLRAIGESSWTNLGLGSLSTFSSVAFAMNDTIATVYSKSGGFNLLMRKQPKNEVFRGAGYPNTLSFPVNGKNGQLITGFSSREDLVVNPETDEIYALHTELSDDSERKLLLKVNRYVNSAPTGITINNNLIVTGQPTGTSIGVFSTSDLDIFDLHEYTLLPSEADNSSFTLTDGELFSAEVFDVAVKSSYSILLQSEDEHGEAVVESLIIQVVDADVPPSDIFLSENQQAEGEPAPFVGSFSSLDANQGETFNYKLVSGEGDEGNSSFFILNGGLFRNGPAFDFDIQESYSIRVRSTETDNLANFTEKIFTIEITDVNFSPVLSQTVSMPSQLDALEDSPFTFELPDGLFEDPEDGILYYSIFKSPAGSSSPADSWLSIDEFTGVVTGIPSNSDVGLSGPHYIHVTDAANSPISSSGFVISVENVNDAPIAVAQQIIGGNTFEDNLFTSNSIHLPTFFSDPDVGDALSYALTNQDDSPIDWLNSFTVTTDGFATFSGTPTNDDVGINIYKVTATDLSNASASTDLRFEVYNSNDLPILQNPISDQIATAGIAYNFQFPDNTFIDIDPGNPVISYQASLSSGAALPAWLSFNSGTRTFSSASIPTNQAGLQYSIRVRATDVAGIPVDDTFLINIVANGIPMQVNPIPNQQTNEDELLTFQFASDVFSDPDGDELSYSATRADGTSLPNWLNFDGLSRTFSGIPSNGDVGLIALRVIADDGKGATGFTYFDLDVLNVNDDPEVKSEIADQVVPENQFFSFQFDEDAFIDVDAMDVLSYSATAESSNLPNWIAFNSETRTFSGTPASSDIGSITIVVTASDNNGGMVADEFIITVIDVNDPPTDITLDGNMVAENGVKDKVVGVFETEDPDANESFTYTLVAGDGDTGNDSFNIDGANLRTNEAFDFESQMTYSIRVQSSDKEGLLFQKIFTIGVIDNVAPTDIELDNQSVDEGMPASTAVGAFSTVDTDDTMFDYLLVEGEGDSDNIAFELSANTLLTNEVFNFDDKETRQIRVQATDSDGNTFQKTFLIAINNTNTAPSIANPIDDQVAIVNTLYTFTIPENTFKDEEENTLSYTVSTLNESELPDWLTFDSETRTLSGTPGIDDIGSISLQLTAADSRGASITDVFALEVTNVSSVDDEAIPMLLYPNPAIDQLSIEVPDSERTNYEITIRSISGKEVITSEKVVSNGTLSISLKGLSSGTYVLTLKVADHVFTRRFLKE